MKEEKEIFCEMFQSKKVQVNVPWKNLIDYEEREKEGRNEERIEIVEEGEKWRENEMREKFLWRTVEK